MSDSSIDDLPDPTEVEPVGRRLGLRLLGMLVVVGILGIVIAVFLTLYSPPSAPECPAGTSECSDYDGPG